MIRCVTACHIQQKMISTIPQGANKQKLLLDQHFVLLAVRDITNLQQTQEIKP